MIIISVISTLVMVLTLNATMLPLNVLQVGVGERNSALFQWMIAAAWVPAALVVSRLSLVLPASAVDRPIGLSTAWRISRENGWRLALLIAGVPWAIRWIEWGVANLFSDGGGAAVGTALYLLMLPLEIALLFVCYQRLIAGNSAS